MPRYFFHLHDGKDIRDDLGEVLPDMRAAQSHGLCFVGEILRSNPEEFLNGDEWSLEIADGDGLILATIDVLVTLSPAATAVLRPSQRQHGP